jgi:tetratricopeptide (TPR) repeat protein
VVLDGFERLLESFVPEEATRTGTDGRTCVDPLARAFLQALIRYPVKSRILLASRIPPQEIEKASCCSGTTLGGLDPIDAIRFLGSQGVKGSDDELRRAGEQWDFHPLSLRLLAGALVNDAELKGEIRHAPWISVAQMSAGNQEDPDTQKLTHLLRFAYDRLRNPSAKEDDSLRELMRRIAAFQSAITFERLAGSMVPTDRDMLKAHLTALRNRGLLSFNSEKCTFEMHPSVRRYFNDQLRTRTSTHEEIWGHLVAVRARLRSGIDNRDEFAAALEQFHQALKHERLDRAVNVFEQSLFVPLFFREGAYRQCQELLQRLEPALGPGQRTSRRATYYQDRDQAWVLNALGLVCARTGEPQRSQELLLRALEHYTSSQDRRAMRVTLGNLVRTQLLLGQLDAAEQTLQHRSDLTADQRRSTTAGRWRLRLANRANAVVNAVGRLLSPDDYRRALRPPPAMAGGDHRSGEITPHIGDRIAGLDPLDRGELHTLRGEPELALLALDRAATILWRRPDALSTVELYRARAWLAADNPQTALESTRKASELWQEATAQSLHHAGNAMSIDLVLGTSHLMLAERKQLPVDISEAERYLVKALNSIRISGYIELLPDALSSWARFCLARGDASGAVEHATQAMNVSRPYPLKYAAASDLLDRIQREVRVRANGSSVLTREASP